MNPALLNSLMQFYASDPAYESEWRRHTTASGDQRTPAEWLYDHIQSSPADMAKFQAFAGGAAGAGGSGVEPIEDVPLEQDLLERVFRDYIVPGMEGDAARRADAERISSEFNRGIDQAQGVLQPLIDGRRLEEEFAFADETGRRLASAVDSEAAGRQAALELMRDDRLAALDPVAQERIRLGDTMVGGINAALEGERDRQVAENALRGFVGGSTFEDAALARAAIGARQNAAEVMGGARLANATDRRGVLDDFVGRRGGAEFDRLSGLRGAADATTGFRKEYFDANLPRSIEAAIKVPALTSQRFSVLGAPDEYGQSGLSRGLKLLDWFSGQPQMPDFQTFQTQASQSGRDLAGLGAGMFGGAMSVGNANKWWQKPATPAPATPPTQYNTSGLPAGYIDTWIGK